MTTQQGRQADAFPNEPTQWEDQDGDGFGDNQSGENPDPYLFDFDNDGYNDSIDPLPKFASPGDLDNDGTPDTEDAFPEDFREWADSDGDGEGDNADPDDDNDGWADTDELRQGTDPYSGASQPVDSFEIVIPGTQVGLGAWDLIGMFGGIPLFFWIMFGFVTRNGRTAHLRTNCVPLRRVTSSSMWPCVGNLCSCCVCLGRTRASGWNGCGLNWTTGLRLKVRTSPTSNGTKQIKPCLWLKRWIRMPRLTPLRTRPW